MKKLLTILIVSVIGLSLLLPSLIFADTATYYTSAGHTTTFDGFAEIPSTTCDTLANFRAASGTNSNSTSTAINFIYMDARACVAGSISAYAKLEMIFDTSGNPIPAGATISNIALTLSIGGGTDPWGSSANLVSFTNASTTGAQNADYNLANRGTTSFASSSVASLKTAGAQTMTFNADGISAFTKNGLNKYQMVESHDFNNNSSGMTGGAGVEPQVWGYTADNASADRPYLTITYSTAPTVIRTIKGMGVTR